MGILSACVAVSTDTHADTRTPAYVWVVGKGTVRVRVADTPAMQCGECSDSWNQTLFDGRMKAGQAMWLWSTHLCVCVQHTYGSFREAEWSPSVVLCPIDSRPYGGQSYEGFIRVEVPTDRP